jgi:thiol-disulfide isomerase/thioredoxin
MCLVRRAQVIVLNFYSDECPHCLSVVEHYRRAAEHFR